MAMAYLVSCVTNAGYINHKNVHAFIVDHGVRTGSAEEADSVGNLLQKNFGTNFLFFNS